MLKLSIPTPCHEDWNKMIPDQQGRHCNACAKTVVDFTSMTDHEIKNYLITKQSERICGRFKSQQLHRVRIELPQNIFHISMPSWKRFLVASLLVFSTTLFSCETETLGKPIHETTYDTTTELIDTSIIPIADSFWKPSEAMIGDVTGIMVIEPMEPERSIELDPDYLRDIKGGLIMTSDTIITNVDTIDVPGLE